MEKIECQVCNNMFVKDPCIGLKIDNEYGLMKIEDMCCDNPTCQQIFMETWKTKQKLCGCGKEATIFLDNYKKRRINSLCEQCFYAQD